MTNQNFITCALPALLASMFILTACGNTGTPNAGEDTKKVDEKIAQIKEDAKQAEDAQTNADTRTAKPKEKLPQQPAKITKTGANSGNLTKTSVAVPPVDSEMMKMKKDLPKASVEIPPVDSEMMNMKEELPKVPVAVPPVDSEMMNMKEELPKVSVAVPPPVLEMTSMEDDLPEATEDTNTAEATEDTNTAETPMEQDSTLPPVKYSNWEATVTLDATADLANPRSQFLQSKDGALIPTGVTLCDDYNSHPGCGAVGSRVTPRVMTANLKTEYYDRQYINGDINDGWAFFQGYIGDTRYYYAGILDSTDLGAPLTGVAETSVEWNGRYNSNVDFDLTITFEANGGRLDAFFGIGTRDVFVRLENARFDTNGVITGTLNYQGFMNNDRTMPIDSATDGIPNTGDSILSGIIGEEGAVAVFVGVNAVHSGGFVAVPPQ